MNDDNQNLEAQSGSPPSACERVRNRMPELWDDALAPIDAARDFGHLEACAECRAEWDQLLGLLGDIPDASISEAEFAWANQGLEEQLTGVLTPAPRSNWSRWVVSTALPLAAGIVAMVLIHTVSKDRDSIVDSLPVSIREVGSWRPSFSEWTGGIEQLLESNGESQEQEG